MVTHLTTNLPVSGLSMGERTGPRVLHYLWSYVLDVYFILPICIGWKISSGCFLGMGFRAAAKKLASQGIKTYLSWVPGHKDVRGNKIADQLAKRGAVTLLEDRKDPPLLSLA